MASTHQDLRSAVLLTNVSAYRQHARRNVMGYAVDQWVFRSALCGLQD